MAQNDQEDDEPIRREFVENPRIRMQFRIDRVLRDELGLLDSQLEEIRQLQGEFREKLLHDPPMEEGLSPNEQIKRLDDHRQEIIDGFEKNLNAILLPAQRERLDQVLLQNRIRTAGTSVALTSPFVDESSRH